MESEDPNYLPALFLEEGVAKIVVDTNVLFTFFFKGKQSLFLVIRRASNRMISGIPFDPAKAFRSRGRTTTMR